MKTTKTIILSLFLAFSSATLQAQRNNSIVGVWHFPYSPLFAEITETRIYGFLTLEDEGLDYEIIGNKIRMTGLLDGEFEIDMEWYFRLINENRLEFSLPEEYFLAVGYRMPTDESANQTVATGVYFPVGADISDSLTNRIEIFDERYAQFLFESGEWIGLRYRIFGNRLYLDGGLFIFEINKNGTLHLVHPEREENVIFERRE